MLDLLDGAEGAPVSGPEQRELRQAIGSKCDNLMAMIDELLKISRLQSGALKPERRFINALRATSVLYELKPLADRKGIRLVNDVPDTIRLYADPDLFREVVQNLVNNAIKFSRTGDTVTLFAPPAENPVIAVRDTGTGISPRLVGDLFKHEVKTTTSGTAGELGTGLGLPLCNDIMQAHGGRLTLETEPGQGSTFFVELPTVRPRVLVVESDPARQSELRAVLEPTGVELLLADSIPAVERCLRESRPHLIIVDVPLTDGSRLSLLERLKQRADSRDIPVIVTTGEPGAVSEEAAIRVGADDFLRRPVTQADLIPRVRRFLG
jgi:CheY-like chemotaxis protein